MKTVKHDTESRSRQGSRHEPIRDASERLAMLAAAQAVPVVEDVTALAVDFWPEDETADDVNAYIYGQRCQDRNVA